MPPVFMSQPSTSLTLSTPYGSATFEVITDDRGSVTDILLPLHGLPDSAFRLTYGKTAEEARTYFENLARILPARIAVARQVPEPPPELLPVVDGIETDGYFHDHPEWAAVYGFAEKAQQRTLRRILRQTEGKELEEMGGVMLPYLIDWLPLAPHRTADLIYGAIGHFGLTAGRDYLLGQLTAAGRHPFTSAILRGLRPYTDTATLTELQRAYAGDRIGPEQVADYLRYLGRFADAGIPDHVAEVLERHPYEPEAASEAWLDYGLDAAETARRLGTRFEQTENYAALNDLVVAINRFDSPHRIDLAAMNHRQETAEWLDLPPVNWPQQLEPAWKQLVLDAPAEEVLALITDYLGRPEPRLQRNALLQLRTFLEREDAPIHFSPALEDRLRKAIGARYDKIYVEALNVLATKPKRELNERVAMLDAVLERSLNSRYRIVILTALRRTGEGEEFKRHAHDFYRRRIQQAGTESELRAISEWLPYLRKYLREAGDLKPLLEARRG
jgi:hypothetical protein